MKPFLYKSFLILLTLVILIGITEWSARTVSTSYSIKDHQLMTKKEQVRVLVLGSSHANFGINPQFLGADVYNFANTSQDLYYDCQIIKKYLKYCPNLKLVVMPISYFTLYFRLDQSEESWRTSFYSAVLHIPNPNQSRFDLSQYSYLRAMEGPIKILSAKRKAILDINEYGYQKLTNPANGLVINDSEGKSRVAFHHKNMQWKNLQRNLGLIREVAGFLKQKGVRLAFITTPVYHTYYDRISDAYYSNMVNSIYKVSGAYDCKYLNYMRDGRFEMQDFMDNDHLNEDGAKKFSIILKKDLLD